MAQSVHPEAAAAAYFPAPQLMQLVWPVPAYVPAAQFTQTSAALSLSSYLPAAQSVHCAAPVAAKVSEVSLV